MRAGCIAKDVIVLRPIQTRAGWYIHGAAQNRRGTVLRVSHILGAPSFSPHRSWGFHSPRRLFAHSPVRQFAHSLISRPRRYRRMQAVPQLPVPRLEQRRAGFVLQLNARSDLFLRHCRSDVAN
jgi:hypothetical protein